MHRPDHDNGAAHNGMRPDELREHLEALRHRLQCRKRHGRVTRDHGETDAHGMRWIGDALAPVRAQRAVRWLGWCDEYNRGIRHGGWFINSHEEETVRGCVVRLTHGRLLAGYGEPGSGADGVALDCARVFSADELRDATWHADECARVIAEACREWTDAEGAGWNAQESIRELRREHSAFIARLRAHGRRPDDAQRFHYLANLRAQVREHGAALRDARQRMEAIQQWEAAQRAARARGQR